MARHGRVSGMLLLAITALLLIGGGIGVRALILRRAEATIERHRTEVEPIVIHRGHQPPPPPVPPPWGADNAWDLLRPAFDALWKVQMIQPPVYLRPEFLNHKDPDAWARILQVEDPHFEACRRAAERSNYEWQGPGDPDLHLKAATTCRHLCWKAFLAWRQGRDAEAVDWLIVALTIAQETARLDQREVNSALCSTELWASDAARLLLSKHGLSAAQLEDFERRLDRLRSSRPRSISELRACSANCRDALLEESEGTVDPAGWKDLFSLRVRLARVLTGIRDAAVDAESVPWTSSAELESRWEELGSRYRQEDVGRIWSKFYWYKRELAAWVRLDLLRVAVGVARFEAAKGRMPGTLEEAGVEGILRRHTTFSGNQLTATPPREAAEGFVGGEIEAFDLEWEIRRR